jgi:hypothetical protein
MAAAADRLIDDSLETVSPELVLVDPALSTRARQSLATPVDTLARLERLLAESRSPHRAAEGAMVENADADAPALPLASTMDAIPEYERGIEDLIATPADEPARSEGTRGDPIPSPQRGPDRHERDTAEELPMPRARVGIDDLIVVPAHQETRSDGRRRAYPMLPARPSGDGNEEDATDAALRRIRERLEAEPPMKPTRPVLSIVSVASALCSVAIFAVDLKLGLAELPRWFPM